MPEYVHNPVLVSEVVAALRPQSGNRYADGTLGGGGHAEALLRTSSPTGWLYGCDRDGAAVENCQRRLEPFAGRFEIRQGNYAEMDQWIPRQSCQGVLLDLGVSSPQLDRPERGFSFLQDGPLDMRMDQRQSLTAAQLVNEESEENLARMFFTLGEEPQARRIARAIVQERRHARLETTGQLARLIERLQPRHGRKRHPATRVFQAVRMAVNDELKSLQSGLAAAWTVLALGGRLAVITFHSMEDKMVKAFGRERARNYTYPGTVDVPELRVECAPTLRWVQRKAIHAGPAELAENPRARSAQLRVMEKIG